MLSESSNSLALQPSQKATWTTETEETTGSCGSSWAAWLLKWWCLDALSPSLTCYNSFAVIVFVGGAFLDGIIFALLKYWQTNLCGLSSSLTHSFCGNRPYRWRNLDVFFVYHNSTLRMSFPSQWSQVSIVSNECMNQNLVSVWSKIASLSLSPSS